MFFLILDNKDAIESAAEKPSCPVFLSWHIVTSSGKSRRAQTPLSVALMVPQEGVGLCGCDPSQSPSPCGRRLMPAPWILQRTLTCLSEPSTASIRQTPWTSMAVLSWWMLAVDLAPTAGFWAQFKPSKTRENLHVASLSFLVCVPQFLPSFCRKKTEHPWVGVSTRSYNRPGHRPGQTHLYLQCYKPDNSCAEGQRWREIRAEMKKG